MNVDQNPFLSVRIHCQNMNCKDEKWIVESDFWSIETLSRKVALHIRDLMKGAYLAGRSGARKAIRDAIDGPAKDQELWDAIS